MWWAAEVTPVILLTLSLPHLPHNLLSKVLAGMSGVTGESLPSKRWNEQNSVAFGMFNPLKIWTHFPLSSLSVSYEYAKTHSIYSARKLPSTDIEMFFFFVIHYSFESFFPFPFILLISPKTCNTRRLALSKCWRLKPIKFSILKAILCLNMVAFTLQYSLFFLFWLRSFSYLWNTFLVHFLYCCVVSLYPFQAHYVSSCVLTCQPTLCIPSFPGASWRLWINKAFNTEIPVLFSWIWKRKKDQFSQLWPLIAWCAASLKCFITLELTMKMSAATNCDNVPAANHISGET